LPIRPSVASTRCGATIRCYNNTQTGYPTVSLILTKKEKNAAHKHTQPAVSASIVFEYNMYSYNAYPWGNRWIFSSLLIYYLVMSTDNNIVDGELFILIPTTKMYIKNNIILFNNIMFYIYGKTIRNYITPGFLGPADR